MQSNVRNPWVTHQQELYAALTWARASSRLADLYVTGSSPAEPPAARLPSSPASSRRHRCARCRPSASYNLSYNPRQIVFSTSCSCAWPRSYSTSSSRARARSNCFIGACALSPRAEPLRLHLAWVASLVGGRQPPLLP